MAGSGRMLLLLVWLFQVLSQPVCTNLMTTADVTVCKRTFALTSATPYSLTSDSGPGSNRYGLIRKFFAFAGTSQEFVVWQDSAKKIWSTQVTGATNPTVAISAATTHLLVAVANNGDTIIYLVAGDASATKTTPVNLQLVKANAATGAEISRVTVDCSLPGLNIWKIETSNSGDMVWNVAASTVGVVFSRTMLTSSDGLNHQGAIAVVFNADTLALVKNWGQTSGHSFANNLLLSGSQFIGMDLGDNYPRGINGISFTSTGKSTKVFYAFKTKHGTTPAYPGLSVAYDPWPEISTPTVTYYKWSNDNECYTELAHKGIIELTDSFMMLFAGENSDPLNNTATAAPSGSLNTARNLAMVRVSKSGYPSTSTVVSTGQASTGGFYDFGGKFNAQSNTGIVWLTSSTNVADSVSRPKTARLGVNKNLVTFETWSASTFASSKVMLIDDVGTIIWGPVQVTTPIRLPQGDDLFVSGGKAYGYVGNGGNLIQYEISLPAAPVPCPLDSTLWGTFPATNPGVTSTLPCPAPTYTGTVTRACSVLGTWSDPDSSKCVAVPQPCPAPGPLPGGWPQTAPNRTATKSCPAGQTGTNTLQCSSAGMWGSEVNTCVALPTCTDGLQNQGETGIDCGCPTCTPPCPACLVCGGIVCGLHGSCVEPNPVCVCKDGWTGSRCEVPPADPCVGNPPSVDCGTHGACSLGACTCFGNWTGARCTVPPAATCTDGIKNGAETAIDCGGSVCPACPTYAWSPNDFTQCSLSCGGGTQTRTVDCKDTTTGAVAPTASCSVAPHTFVTSQACNEDACPVYTWKSTDWSVCSANCNNGTQTREVNCYSSVGNVIVATGCAPELKPVTVQSCNTQPCTAPHWATENWDACSRLCGGGTQSRAVNCLDDQNAPTPAANCPTDEKPPTSQSCNLQMCESYNWLACPTFYPCTAQCNGGGAMVGIQYRDVFCRRDSDGEAVDVSLCRNDSRPTIALSICNTQPCQNYNWMADANWGPCTLQDNGLYQRKRTFHCHKPDGATALTQDCVRHAGNLPIAVLPCTPGTCASPEGCPIVEIADVLNQCTVDQLKNCAPSAPCGDAGRALDYQLVTLGFTSRSAASLKCVTDYVATLQTGDRPTELVIYVNNRLAAGQDICGLTSAGSSLTPLISIVLVTLLAAF